MARLLPLRLLITFKPAAPHSIACASIPRRIIRTAATAPIPRPVRRTTLLPRTYEKSVRTASVGGSLALLAILALLSATLDDIISPADIAMATQEGSSPAVAASSDTQPVSQLLPGRPGNLTPEQEAKLRELWILSGKLFGVITDEQLAEIAAAHKASTPNTPVSPTSAEAPKGRFGFLRRKAKDETTTTSTTSDTVPGWSTSTIAELGSSGGAGNDKHGQAELFRQAMANSTPEELRDAFWGMTKADHPDGLFLRFLRARKWDVNAAQVMAMAALHWRLTAPQVDEDIMHLGEMGMVNYAQDSDPAKKSLGEDFLDQIRLGKSFVHGFDKQGRPCCYIRVRLHHAGDQSELSQERFTVYTIETARLMLKPPVDTATLIFDMTDFGLSNMDNAPIKFMIKCFEANYPESLGVVLIHKAPWVFQGIWRMIRGWLDPVVASKINFTNNLQDVSKYIDLETIPKELGGPDPFEYSYPEPVPGENDAMQDTTRRKELEEQRKKLAVEYEDAVKEWALLPLSSDGKKAWDANRAKRDDVARRLAENYWLLDPLVRARSLYDRLGLLPGSSKKTTGSSSTPAPAPAAAAAAVHNAADGKVEAAKSTGEAAPAPISGAPKDESVPTEQMQKLEV